MSRRIRDPDLLEAIDAKGRSTFSGIVWRAVHEKRHALDPSRAGGRWDLGVTDVLYTSLSIDGAIAEVEYYLALQPVFPSKMRHVCYEIELKELTIVRIETLAELIAMGVDEKRYRERSYERTAEIGDAAAFLGCNGLIVPSARFDCLNLVIFTEGLEPQQLGQVGAPKPIDWQERRRKYR